MMSAIARIGGKSRACLEKVMITMSRCRILDTERYIHALTFRHEHSDGVVEVDISIELDSELVGTFTHVSCVSLALGKHIWIFSHEVAMLPCRSLPCNPK